MTGGLLQISSFGNQDIMLTGNPEITFFNSVYRRYTNFGIKTIEVSFDNNVNFNTNFSLNIPKNGDLLSNLILKIKLPAINLNTLNTKLKNFFENVPLQNNNNINITYLNFIIKFKSILLYYTKKFFANNNSKTNYILNFSNYLLENISYSEFIQYYYIVDYYFTITINNSYILSTDDYYKNCSLFKLINIDLEFIYKNFTVIELNYTVFESVIYKNIEIIENFSNLFYNQLIVINPERLINFAWIQKIAIFMFENIDIYIGSNPINQLKNDYINIYGELNYKNTELYHKLIGYLTDITKFSFTQDETTLYLPVPFWFTKNYGLSFPLIALQYNDLELKVKTKSLYSCINIELNIPDSSENIYAFIYNEFINNSNEILNSKLEITVLLEYIFLDRLERKKFAQSSHEYLITQIQYNYFNNISSVNKNIELNFFHCGKELMWFANYNKNLNIFGNNYYDKYYITNEPNNLINNTNYTKYVNLLASMNNLFNFEQYNLYVTNINYQIDINLFINNFTIDFGNSTTYKYNIIVPITNSTIVLNGTNLVNQEYKYFNFIHPFNYYNSTPALGINVYSFSLIPTEVQPAGSCNFSRIPKTSLNLTMIDTNLLTNTITSSINTDLITDDINDFTLKTILVNYNILRIIGGIAGLAYTY